MATDAACDTLFVGAPGCARPHAAEAGCGFRVVWSINPHMRPGSACPTRAARQHARLVRVLRQLGAHVEVLPFVHGAFDSVFVKDNALLEISASGLRALLGRPLHPERAREQRARHRALAERGFEVVEVRDARLEGGDVVRLETGPVLLGHGFRSSASAAAALERFTDAEVVPLPLVDARLYHLDVALGALSDGTVLACPEAFRPGTLERLARVRGVRDVLPVPLAEAAAFGLNFVEVGATVALAPGAKTVERLLRRCGRGVVRVDTSQFQNAGGSVACLVARVHRRAAAAPGLLRAG